jgi:hypothetical protein
MSKILSFEKFIKESPDTVYDNNGNEFSWSDKDARPFGWLDIIPQTDPIYLRATSDDMTHEKLVSGFLVAFQAPWNKRNPDLIAKSLEMTEIETTKPWMDVIQELGKNQNTWTSLIDGSIYQYFKEVIFSDNGELAVRSEIFKKSGRIWLNSKIISFWNRLFEISKEDLNTVFSSYNINPEVGNTFLIDLVNPSKMNLEETPEKKLPTISEFFGGKKEKSEKLSSKEDEKKMREMLAQKHIETDPAKRKAIQKELGLNKETPPWGSTKVAEKNPLTWRYAKYQESFSFFDYFKMVMEAREVEFGKYKGYQGKAKVYVNLHASVPKEKKLVYSVQGYIPDPRYPKTNRSKSKVIGYDNKLVLNDVTFKVNERGWKKVQEQGGKKNVHSMVIGTISDEKPTRYSTIVTYDPRRYRYFVRFEGETPIPIKSAKKVAFNPDGLTADGIIDMSEQEIRAEGPLLTPEEMYYMQRRKEELAYMKKLKRKNKINDK